jgi:hypothetical protein
MKQIRIFQASHLDADEIQEEINAFLRENPEAKNLSSDFDGGYFTLVYEYEVLVAAPQQRVFDPGTSVLVLRGIKNGGYRIVHAKGVIEHTAVEYVGERRQQVSYQVRVGSNYYSCSPEDVV